MEQERYRRSRATLEQFDTSLMYDDIEKIREQEEEEEKDQNDKLSFAGMMALTAGAILMLANIFGGLPEFIAFLQPFLLVIGVGSLSYGFYKTLRLAFRQKDLNFPALNVYRKTRPSISSANTTSTSESQTRTRARTRTRSRSNEDSSSSTSRRTYRQRPRSYARGNKKVLTRSRKNRIFTGVAGGMAEYANISPALIRFAFVAGLFVSFGIPFFFYLLLSIVLPPNFDELKNRKSRGGNGGRAATFERPPSPQ